MNNRPIFIIAAIVALTVSAQTPADTVLFKKDFESANADSVPEELMILAGQFSVKETGGNKLLELPGTPLEDFGALFGPAESDGSPCGHAFVRKAPSGSHPASVLG